MSKMPKTNKRQRLDIAARPRRGGQPGNRNAAKPVHPLSNRIAALKRRARALIRAADKA